MPVGKDLQNDCDSPNKWRAFYSVALGLPVVIPICVFCGLLGTALMKWIVIGKFKPGCYSIDGLYYFRWLFVHHLEVFAIRWLLPTLPMRNTCFFNYWLRLMGADIGKNVVIDSLDIHEMCCLTVESNVTIQNNAMLTGHAFVKIKDSTVCTDLESNHLPNTEQSKDKQALFIGNCWLKQGSTVGPYAMVHPTHPHPFKKNFPSRITIVEGVLPGFQSTSRLGQTIQLKQNNYNSTSIPDALVWTPRIGILGQLEGFLTMITLQALAFTFPLWIMYHLFVPSEPTFFTWIGRCWLFFSPWPMGIPYAILLCIYKKLLIGSFRAESYSTPRLDKYRFILRCLLQSRIHMGFEVASASTEILNTFYRIMGMKIGWNSQVMPLDLVEFDLFSIGNNCSFGGQVMVFCRNSVGKHEACKIGNFSAITNSAGMLSGSSIGDNSLVGNLTILPNNFSVPSDSKCVGTKYIDGALSKPVVFSNPKGKENKKTRQSKVIATLHLLAALMLDVVYLFEFAVIAWIMISCQKRNPGKIGQMHLVHNEWKVAGGYLITCGIVYIATIVTMLVIVVIKKCTPRFLGKHQRDSFIFVLFIWLTKHQMNMESWSFVYNGTPIQSLFYRLLGGEISLSSRLFMRFFIDVDGLVVGEKSILAYDSYLEQHKKTATTLEFSPINILKKVIVGQRSIILEGAYLGNRSKVYPLSAVPPKEIINSEEVRGGLLANSYYLRSHVDALVDSSSNLSSLLHLRRNSLSLKSNYMSKHILSKSSYDKEVNMVVVGAGLSGLVAAQEFQKKGLTVQILEKTSKVMGCWNTIANSASHVAVTEATYRISLKLPYDSEYPHKSEVLNYGNDFFKSKNMDKFTEFGAEVKHIEDLEGSSPHSFKKKHGHCIVTYQKDSKTYKIRCKGVFIATGAQSVRREVSFPGEESFTGISGYGSNSSIDPKIFKNKNVCIIGGGAFTIENIKTALLYGANHVTVLHRSDLQVWPRVIHYMLSTEKNSKFLRYSELYNKVADWAGLSVGVGPNYDIAPFMHPDTRNQPTANDCFFALYKAGLVSLIYGEIDQVNSDSLCVRNYRNDNISEIKCDVLVKCLGWNDPGSFVKKIFPKFKSRNFIFLNKSPRLVFVCDPKYRHSDEVGGNKYSDVLDTAPIGGTYSVPILSRIAATLQIYSLGTPLRAFDEMIEGIPSSDQPTCSWSESKFQYPKAKELSEVIYNLIEQNKALLSEEKTLNEHLTMNMDLLMDDLKLRESNVEIMDNSFGGGSSIELVKGFENSIKSNLSN